METSILFLVPRLHTNMLGWLDGLGQLGVTHKTLAMKSSTSENYQFGAPQLVKTIELSWLSSKRKAWLHEKLNLPSLKWLLREVQQIAPKYIIVRVELNVTSLIFLLAIKSTKIPYVIYSQWPLIGLDPIRSRIRKIIVRLTAADIITPCLSKNEPWTIIPQLKSNSNNLFLVPFSIPSHGHEEIPLNKLDRKTPLIFLTIGKFQIRKNHIASLKALLVNEAFLESNCNAIIIGEVSTKEHESVFQEVNSFLASELNGSRVQLKTNLSHSQTLKEISKCDVFFLLSINEPASISNLEAMSFGKPVIIMNGNGTANYLRSGEGGFIVSDFDEFDKKITTFIGDRNLLVTCQRENLKRIKDISNPRKNAKYLINILSQSNNGKPKDG